MSVLVQYAHPWPTRSRVGSRLAQAARAIPGVVVNDLYEHYPEMHIDVGREQALLEDATALVLLHPLYWYSSPAILKEWQDAVLVDGFAYGEGGDKLHGKRMLTATTAGGSRNSYSAAGAFQHSVDDLLKPFKLTAQFCAMTWLEPFVVYSADDITAGPLDEAAAGFTARLLDLQEASHGA